MSETENDTQTEVENDDDSTDLKELFSIKGVTRAVVGHSVRFTIVSAITALVPVETRKDRLRVAVASYALSGLVSEKAQDYVCQEIDEKVAFYRKVRDEVRKLQSEIVSEETEENGVTVHKVTTL